MPLICWLASVLAEMLKPMLRCDVQVREMAMKQIPTRGLKDMMMRAYGEDDESGNILSSAGESKVPAPATVFAINEA